LTLSSVLHTLRQWATGNAVNASRSPFASINIAATTGKRGSSLVAISSSWSRTDAASGWAKIVPIAASTISAEPFGIRASTLRRKCTLHRCHAAPSRTAPMAAFKPS
jgi:hypothetical protein